MYQLRHQIMKCMRIFSEILLKNEHRETSLAAALKNAIYYPENEDSYLNPLETIE